MQRRSAALFRYRVPLARGAALRRRPLERRDGLIVRLAEDGRQGWGEVAPLPGFSRETLAQAQAEAGQWLERWQTGAAPAIPALPAVGFGISCAQAELDRSLPEAASYRSALLCPGHAQDPAAARQAVADGMVAKLKVGQGAPESDAVSVNALLAARPELALRLDANRAWTPAQAQAFARGLRPECLRRIEFLEEPCRTPLQSLAFARDTGIPIAWDETVRERGFALTARPGVSAVVIKPTLVGGLGRCRECIEQAHALGLAAVISSSIESSLGLTQLARLASWLTPQTLPGLDTLGMMQAQVLRPWPGVDLPVMATDGLACLWQR